jgi:uncharacterized membrane protein
MRVRHFLDKVEHERIHRAVQAAEEKTSGRIVVYIARRRASDPVAEGHRLFRKLGMETEKEKAGLLFFIAPKSQMFSVVGGTALHDRLGQEWWDALAEKIGAHFKEGRFTEGLISGVEEAGRILHLHFRDERPPALRAGRDRRIRPGPIACRV